MTSPTSRQRAGGLRRTLKVYYAYIFLYDFIFAYAIYTAYFSLQGLSAATIGILLAVWSISGLMFELPSGALSDRFDRRVLLVLSPLIKAVCFILWAFAGGEAWLFALGFVFWALGESFCSGTKEAVLYEHVHRARFGRGYDKLVGRERAVYEAGGMIGASMGGLMTLISPEFTLWFSAVPLIGASLVAMALKDVRGLDEGGASRKRHRPQVSHVKVIRDAVAAVATHPRLRFLTLYIGLGVIALAVFDEFEQLLYLAVNIPLWVFGFLGAAFGLMTIIVSAQAYRIKTLSWAVWVFPAVAGLSLLTMGTLASLFVLIPLAVAHACMIPVDVQARVEFQKTMSGQSRATTTSALTVFIEVVALVLLLVVGGLIEMFGVVAAYQIGGLYLLLFSVWSYWQGRGGFHEAAAD